MLCRFGLALLAVIGLRATVAAAAPPPAQNDSDEPAATGETYAAIVRSDEPVAYWRFDDEHGAAEFGDRRLAPQAIVGPAKLLQPGPPRARFPLFGKENRATLFDKPGSLRYDDPGPNSPFDFAAGDDLTIEAWVNPTKLSNGQQVYIVGKGRTGNKEVAKENQNWSLRLVGKDGGCRLSFLFRDADNRPGVQDDWHRWTSERGFGVNSGWHHIAVVYRFGRGDSIVGYVDGRPSSGSWDYGGKSDEAPVVDDDQVWIGSASDNNPSNSFVGGIDEVAIYRTALSAERIAARWRVIEPKPYVTAVPIPKDRVLVEILEGMPDEWTWDFVPPTPSERFTQYDLAFVELPRKYTSHGVIDDRSSPFVLWAHTQIELPAGKHRFLIRSRSAARLFIDDRLVLENPFQSNKTDGHNPYVPVQSKISPGIRPLQPGDHEEATEIELAAGPHRLRYEVFIGGKKRRPEVGETSVSIAAAGSEDFWVIGWPRPSQVQLPPDENRPSAGAFSLNDSAWTAWERTRRSELVLINQRRRAESSRDYATYWQKRHDWARAVAEKRSKLPYASIDAYIDAALAREKLQPGNRCDDYAFIRRIYLDIVGITPQAAEVEAFVRDERPDKRARFIDRLLDTAGWADNWMGYWQDALAENPNIVNPTLNNTGPFRWWLYEALLDNKPLDRFATELILMEGSTRYGGTAGFAVASENDAPLAAKAQNLGLAFLAMDMRCARCHDAPSHDFSQEDLFNLAAMLQRSDQTLPKTSTIPGDAAQHASLMVKVTLKPGQKIPPRWPFEEVSPDRPPAEWLSNPGDPREELALRITSPENPRFARVMVNRIWQRYFGRGIVEPVDDWETAQPIDADLLEWLSREFITHNYDAKHIARLIFNSRAYQSEPTSDRERARFFAAPLRRRMTAEQVLDSLLAATGKETHTEEMNVDVDSSRLETSSINLGLPRRAWQFTTMGNERDRPSLSLPAAQTAVTLLETFGWRASRQDPLTYREGEPTVLQPAILANGVLAKRAAQLSEDSTFVGLALAAETPADFVEQVYRQVLSRPPTPQERDLFVELLSDNFSSRKTGAPAGPRPGWPARDGVSWSNHLQTKSNEVRLAWQREVEKGDAVTTQLVATWRERAEDMVWALVNSPEFVWIP
jgi:hypothetical protein